MRALTACFWFLLGVLCSSFLDGELKFRWRQLARVVVRVAARRIPAEHRDRIREEALADLESLEAEGRDGAQVGYALRVFWSVPAVKRELLDEKDVRALAEQLSHRSHRLFVLLMKVAGPVMLIAATTSFMEVVKIQPTYMRWVWFGEAFASFALAGITLLCLNLSNRAEKLLEVAQKADREL